MNYLAHAYLSFDQPDVLTGNMISDFVKGRKKFDYPDAIQLGMELHRGIDHFTDTHSSTRNIAALFKPVYRLYGGAFADIVYDHFLANDRNEFPSLLHLMQFTTHTYQQLAMQAEFFPAPFASMFPYMRTQNWLYHYHEDAGIQKSFGGLGRRAAYIPETETAYQIFLDNKDYFREQYDLFFRS